MLISGYCREGTGANIRYGCDPLPPNRTGRIRVPPIPCAPSIIPLPAHPTSCHDFPATSTETTSTDTTSTDTARKGSLLQRI